MKVRSALVLLLEGLRMLAVQVGDKTRGVRLAVYVVPAGCRAPHALSYSRAPSATCGTRSATVVPPTTPGCTASDPPISVSSAL
jgi:hypothetical protein